MKRHLFALALLACAGPAALTAQPGNPGFQSMKITASDLPVFPPTLIARGVTSGAARVVARVDESGKLADHLVTAYTHPTLAAVTVDAMQRWQYAPATLNGEPVSAQAEIVVEFRADGVVISQNMTEHFLDHVARARGGPEFMYQPTTLRELDGIPTPLHVVSPYYNDEMVSRGLKGDVWVEFYIDEQGQVRMPVVTQRDHEELAAHAVQAVRQWSFEPPTRRGRPVLVLARQHFRFRPAEPATATPVAATGPADS